MKGEEMRGYIDIFEKITKEQRKSINKAIQNGYPVEIAPYKDGFTIFSTDKKIIGRECGSDRT